MIMILAQSYNHSFTSPPNWFHISALLCHYFHNIRGQICIKKIYPDRTACIDVDLIYRIQGGQGSGFTRPPCTIYSSIIQQSSIYFYYLLLLYLSRLLLLGCSTPDLTLSSALCVWDCSVSFSLYNIFGKIQIKICTEHFWFKRWTK